MGKKVYEYDDGDQHYILTLGDAFPYLLTIQPHTPGTGSTSIAFNDVDLDPDIDRSGVGLEANVPTVGPNLLTGVLAVEDGGELEDTYPSQLIDRLREVADA